MKKPHFLHLGTRNGAPPKTARRSLLRKGNRKASGDGRAAVGISEHPVRSCRAAGYREIVGGPWTVHGALESIVQIEVHRAHPGPALAVRGCDADRNRSRGTFEGRLVRRRCDVHDRIAMASICINLTVCLWSRGVTNRRGTACLLVHSKSLQDVASKVSVVVHKRRRGLVDSVDYVVPAEIWRRVVGEEVGLVGRIVLSKSSL